MKVVALGDLHCGHHAGLTPPSWWASKSVKPSVHEMQKQCWQWYAKQAKRVGHVDVLICNGDAIDGKGDLKDLNLGYVRIAWDGNDIAGAARAAGVQEVHHADLERFSILSIWNQDYVHVYGK